MSVTFTTRWSLCTGPSSRRDLSYSQTTNKQTKQTNKRSRLLSFLSSSDSATFLTLAAILRVKHDAPRHGYDSRSPEETNEFFVVSKLQYGMQYITQYVQDWNFRENNHNRTPSVSRVNPVWSFRTALVILYCKHQGGSAQSQKFSLWDELIIFWTAAT